MRSAALVLSLVSFWASATDTVNVSVQGSVATVHATYTVAAKAEAVMAILTDFEHQAAFIPGVRESIVLGRSQNEATVRQTVAMQVGFLTMTGTATRVVRIDGRTITARTVESDAGDTYSVTELSEAAGVTTVTYSATLKPKSSLALTSVGVNKIREQGLAHAEAIRAELGRRAP